MTYLFEAYRLLAGCTVFRFDSDDLCRFARAF